MQFMPGSRSLVTLTDSFAAKKLVQEEVLRSKRTYRDIARSAAVASSTISNIAIGHTQWPRIETIIRILGALGWVIRAERGK
jgi:transcriptional regulator with XRE-family HTH domain